MRRLFAALAVLALLGGAAAVLDGPSRSPPLAGALPPTAFWSRRRGDRVRRRRWGGHRSDAPRLGNWGHHPTV
jgi:hypothetical protein